MKNEEDRSKEISLKVENNREKEFTEVKELIQQAWLIKESLNHIFFTPYLREYRKLFSRSEHFKYEQFNGNQSVN